LAITEVVKLRQVKEKLVVPGSCHNKKVFFSKPWMKEIRQQVYSFWCELRALAACSACQSLADCLQEFDVK
jgi:hypothetical protein